MKIFSEETGTEYLFDTSVENIFINEYMPIAPDNYVKVYLLAKMYMDSGRDVSNEDLAKSLRIGADDVEKALIYWAKNGCMRRTPEGIEFVSLKEKLYGRHKKRKTAKITGDDSSILENEQVKRLASKLEPLLGENFGGGTGIQQLIWWLEDLRATEDVIEAAAVYCAKRGKTNMNYIEKVVRDWTQLGLLTKDDVENHLEETDQRHYAYRRVMKALGFHRSPTEKECRIIDSWFDDLSCSMKDILAACDRTSGISNPNINYVNTVLRKGKGYSDPKEKAEGVSNNVVRQYYSYLRKRAEDEARKRRTEMEKRVPELARLEEELLSARQELTKAMISGGVDKREKVSGVKDRIRKIEADRDRIMAENNIPAGYDNVRYSCRICGDTGLAKNGSRCRCWEQRAKEAALWYQKRKMV